MAFILTNEEEHLIIIHLVKDKNPKWIEIRVVLIDKDMVIRIVFNDLFLFHVLKTFKREITKKKKKWY